MSKGLQLPDLSWSLYGPKPSELNELYERARKIQYNVVKQSGQSGSQVTIIIKPFDIKRKDHVGDEIKLADSVDYRFCVLKLIAVQKWIMDLFVIAREREDLREPSLFRGSSINSHLCRVAAKYVCHYKDVLDCVKWGNLRVLDKWITIESRYRGMHNKKWSSIPDKFLDAGEAVAAVNKSAGKWGLSLDLVMTMTNPDDMKEARKEMVFNAVEKLLWRHLTRERKLWGIDLRDDKDISLDKLMKKIKGGKQPVHTEDEQDEVHKEIWERYGCQGGDSNAYKDFIRALRHVSNQETEHIRRHVKRREILEQIASNVFEDYVSSDSE